MPPFTRRSRDSRGATPQDAAVTDLLRDDCWPLLLRECAEAGLDVAQITNTDATRDALEQRWYAALDSSRHHSGGQTEHSDVRVLPRLKDRR